MKVPISKARARLFELAELVRRAGDDTAVVLEQRGAGEGVVLVREAHLNYLEDRVKQIDKQKDKPFVLRGSLSSDLDDDELLAVLKDLRKGWSTAPPRRRR